MRSRVLIPSLAVALVGVAGCGSSSSSSNGSTSASTSPTTATSAAQGKAVTRTYTVKMTGAAETPAGAPGGTAKAVVTLSTKQGKVCWTFTSLNGFSKPVAAHIHAAPAGKAGNIVVPLSTGATFLAKGCAPASATLISAIAANPHAYYVNIHSKQYPNGAVRAQL